MVKLKARHERPVGGGLQCIALWFLPSVEHLLNTSTYHGCNSLLGNIKDKKMKNSMIYFVLQGPLPFSHMFRFDEWRKTKSGNYCVWLDRSECPLFQSRVTSEQMWLVLCLGKISGKPALTSLPLINWIHIKQSDEDRVFVSVLFLYKRTISTRSVPLKSWISR